MSGAEVVLVICVVVLATACVLLLGVLLGRRLKAQAPAAPAPVEVMVDQGARVFDPNNPPHYAVYNPKVYDQAKAPRCSCHQRPLDQGDKVLIWPIADHPDNAMDLFCQETYEAGVPE